MSGCNRNKSHCFYLKSILGSLILGVGILIGCGAFQSTEAQSNIGDHVIHFYGTAYDQDGNPESAGIFFYDAVDTTLLTGFNSNPDGTYARSLRFFTDTTLTDIKDDFKDLIPEGYSLSNMFANPAVDVSKTRVSVPVFQEVNIGVYNVLGQEVVKPQSFDVRAGTTEFTFSNLDNLAEGMYFVRAVYNAPGTGSFPITQKLVKLNSGSSARGVASKVGYNKSNGPISVSKGNHKEYVPRTEDGVSTQNTNSDNFTINSFENSTQNNHSDNYAGNIGFEKVNADTIDLTPFFSRPIYEFLVSANSTGIYDQVWVPVRDSTGALKDTVNIDFHMVGSGGKTSPSSQSIYLKEKREMNVDMNSDFYKKKEAALRKLRQE